MQMAALPSDWQPAMRDMRREWKALSPSALSVADWEQRLTSMAEAVRRAKARGTWKAGRADLLPAPGHAGDELVHSNVLAWLLAPSGPHGWGPALLVDFVK